MQRDAQRIMNEVAPIDRHTTGPAPTRANGGLVHIGDGRQFVHATSYGGDLVNGHGSHIAMGNRRLQAPRLPRALTKNAPCGHLAPMGKRGDPFVGGRIRFAREARGLSQSELGRRLGIEQGTISGIETAHRPAGKEMLVDLGEALQIPVDFFFEKDLLLANIMLALKLMPRDEVAGLWLFVRGRLPPDTPTLPTQ